MQLGKKIRSLRKELGKSLEDLAKESGLSIGLLSQIERDITGPSVESLWKIAKALNVSMNYFFDNYEENNPVVRKNERKQLKLPNSNVTYELLSPNLNRKIEFLIRSLKIMKKFLRKRQKKEYCLHQVWLQESPLLEYSLRYLQWLV